MLVCLAWLSGNILLVTSFAIFYTLQCDCDERGIISPYKESEERARLHQYDQNPQTVQRRTRSEAYRAHLHERFMVLALNYGLAAVISVISSVYLTKGMHLHASIVLLSSAMWLLVAVIASLMVFAISYSIRCDCQERGIMSPYTRATGALFHVNEGAINIFIRGPWTGLHYNNTVGDILQCLRFQRRIADLERFRPVVSAMGRFCHSTETLHDLQAVNNMCFYVNYQLLGGAVRVRRDPPERPSRSATSFTRAHVLKTDRPEFYYPVEGSDGDWYCRQCKVVVKDAKRSIPNHEQTATHREALRRHQKSSLGAAQAIAASESSTTSMAPGPEDAVLHALNVLSRSSAERFERDYGAPIPPPFNENMDVDGGLPTSGMAAEPGNDIGLFVDDLRGLWQLSDPAALDAVSDVDSSDDSSDSDSEDDGDDSDSDVGDVEREDEESDSDSDDELDGEGDTPSLHNNVRKRRQAFGDEQNPWYPWPDRQTCVLDILRHVPRSAFSDKQNQVIHWALSVMGVADVPSDRSMKDITRVLQRLGGVRTLRFEGALGHVYYTNELSAIISQEMANPEVRSNLRFMPEQTTGSLSETWQASRWLDELNPELLTQVIYQDHRPYFIYEPALLQNGEACIPVRWFTRADKVFAKAWPLVQSSDNQSWVVQKHGEKVIEASRLMMPFDRLAMEQGHVRRGLPSPCRLLVQELVQGPVQPWTLTDPAKGNKWRERAGGRKVVAFPIWLYCDDTSGNMSKKWNKHNSFLFTAAGLPRHIVQKESSVHFLSTSNKAPPLEMLEGIVEQLKSCQENGIWAYDAVDKQMVLVIPSVLAVLGDNPMQSEFCCHRGLAANYFCRVCWVHKGVDDEDDASGPADDDAATSVTGVTAATAKKRKKKKKKRPLETLEQMKDRLSQFMKPGERARSRSESMHQFDYQFQLAKTPWRKDALKLQRLKTGLRDPHQDVYLEQIQAAAGARGKSQAEKEARVADLLSRLPRPEDMSSPIWKIDELDPHQDTPVEILHVILLGFVKYYWRDAMARLKDSEKAIVADRLSSFDTRGLGLPPLPGPTVVNLSGSLVGRDFRGLVQAAPFVLYGFESLGKDILDAWISLSLLVSLVWQPEIKNIDTYTANLESAIEYFLTCACKSSPRWFNKPKFHILTHLPAHVRRFGPAMLFATEGFESFNAVIRSHSVHSNRQAPSRDIARSLASSNRVRHLASGGYFIVPSLAACESAHKVRASSERVEMLDGLSPWQLKVNSDTLGDLRWTTVGKQPRALLQAHAFSTKFLGHGIETGQAVHSGLDSAPVCEGQAARKPLSQTRSFEACGEASVRGCGFDSAAPVVISREALRFVDGTKKELCRTGDWVALGASRNSSRMRVARVQEIVQIPDSHAERVKQANFVLVQEADLSNALHSYYKMRRVTPSQRFDLVSPSAIVCTLNVQHNCADNRCDLSNTREEHHEREAAGTFKAAIRHFHTDDLILNAAQMRNAYRVAELRVDGPSLDRVAATTPAIEREFVAQRKRKAAAKAAKAAASAPAAAQPATESTETGDTTRETDLATQLPPPPDMPPPQPPQLFPFSQAQMPYAQTQPGLGYGTTIPLESQMQWHPGLLPQAAPPNHAQGYPSLVQEPPGVQHAHIRPGHRQNGQDLHQYTGYWPQMHPPPFVQGSSGQQISARGWPPSRQPGWRGIHDGF
ncbi:unnamed protein product [Peniophora sp. CBMAI 1063]|nr:unnamed protein product [Peniophora sp. CBMAI 1063]